MSDPRPLPGGNATSHTPRGGRWPAIVGVALLPLLVMGWMLPGFSAYTLGADYVRYPVEHQLAGMFSLAHGVWPVYLPRFALGQSAAALTLGQLFHPISHLGRLLPGYWDGHAREVYSFLSLLSLGVGLAALYALFLRLRLAPTYALLIALTGIFNLRMLHLFVYGASLQNYVGYILLCVAIVRYPISRRRIVDGLFIAFATYLTICGGHPQMAYYGLLGAAFVLVVTPFYLTSAGIGLATDLRSTVRSTARTTPWIAAGGLLSAAYALPFYFDFMSSGGHRIHNSFVAAASPFETTAFTLLASLFAPLQADIHTAFAGLSLTAMAVLVPLAAFLGRRVLEPIALALWAWIVFVMALAVTRDLPLYGLFWSYFPFADSFRISGRSTLMLIFPGLLLLGWLFRAPAAGLPLGRGRVRLRPYAVVAAASLACMAMFPLLSSRLGGHELAPPVFAGKISPTVETILVALGFVSLALVAVAGVHRGTRRPILITACIVVVLHAALLMRFGSYTTEKVPTPTFDEIASSVRRDRGYLINPGMGMTPGITTEYAQRVPKPNRVWRVPYASLAFAALPVDDVDAAYSALASPEPSAPRVVAVGLEPERAAALVPRDRRGMVRLLAWNGNSMALQTRSRSASLLVLQEPFAPNWEATVDGEDTRVYLADGLRMAVWLPRGAHRVELRYRSRATVAGVALSLATLGLLAALALAKLDSRLWRSVSLAALVAALLGVFVVWHHSLYAPSDFGVTYTWRRG